MRKLSSDELNQINGGVAFAAIPAITKTFIKKGS